MLQFLGLSAYWSYYFMGIILIPGILLGIYAQSKVNSTFNKYANVMSNTGHTASEVAKIMLSTAGCSHISVTRINGHLTDNYNHRQKTVDSLCRFHFYKFYCWIIYKKTTKRRENR